MDKYLYLLFCESGKGWVPYHKKLIGVFDNEDEVKDTVIYLEDNFKVAKGSCLTIEKWTINKKEDKIIESLY